MTAKNHSYTRWYVYNLLKLGKYKATLSLFLFIIGIFLLPKVAYLATISPDKIIELTNEVRKEENINQLSENSLLTIAAQNKAQDILKEQTFQHGINGRKFSTWIRDVKYDYSHAGENLAIDFVTSEGVLKAWLESEGHRKNLLHPDYREIGVGVAQGLFNEVETIVVAQIFGTATRMTIPAEVLARNEKIKQAVFPQVLGEREKILNTQTSITVSSNPIQGISPYPALNAAIFALPLAIAIFYVYMFFLTRLAGENKQQKI